MRFIREFLTILNVFCGVQAKIYNPCEVAHDILTAKVPKIGRSGEFEPLQCSPRDIGRLVCVASLHNFDTEYSYTSGNDTFVGIFGVPRKKATNVSSIITSQQEFVMYQMNLRMKKQIAVSEVICNYYLWFMDNYMVVLKFWNITDKFGEVWNKRDVNCQDYKLRVFVVDEKFSNNYYKPGVMDDFSYRKSNRTQQNDKLLSSEPTANSTEDDEFYEKPCHGDFYCGDFVKCPHREQFNRVDKSRMERKVEKFVRVIDWTVIVLWFVIVVGGIAWGVWYIRNPRRRGRHHDDWSRPILTAHYAS